MKVMIFSDEYYPYYTVSKYSKREEDYADIVVQDFPKEFYDRFLQIEKEHQLFHELLRAYAHENNLDIIEKTAVLKGLI